MKRKSNVFSGNYRVPIEKNVENMPMKTKIRFSRILKLRYLALVLLVPMLFMQDEEPFYNESQYFPILMKRVV